MIKHIFVFIIFLSMALPAYSAQLYLLDFDLYQGEKLIDRGKTTVSSNSHSWNRGLTRSYLKLKCNPQRTGKTEKLLSTVDLFSGLHVTHKLVGEQIEVSIKYTTVKPRLVEIRALPGEKCENLAPIQSSISENYSYAARNTTMESRKFGKNMNFRVKIVPLGKVR